MSNSLNKLHQIHLSKQSYVTKVRARSVNQLTIDLLTSNIKITINELIKYILSGKIFIPAYLNTNFYDVTTYNVISDTIQDLTLSEQELDNINTNLNKHSQFIYKDITFTKALLQLIQPNRPFTINHPFCWSSQSIFIVTITNKELIDKAKEIGLAFWYQPIYPENSYNLIFVLNEAVTDYRIAYMINQALNYYFNNSSTLNNSNLSRYFYGSTNVHSGFKNVNIKLDVYKLMRNIQINLLMIAPNMILDFTTNFEAKVRLRHSKLVKERTFQLFAMNNPSFFKEKDNPYYVEYVNQGFMFLHRPIEAKLTKSISARQVKNYPIIDLYAPLNKDMINVPLKLAKQYCPLLNDLIEHPLKLSQEEINLIISNIRFFKFGIREILANSDIKEKILWALSHYNQCIDCSCCKYKCGSNTDLYSFVRSLDNRYIENNQQTNLVDINNIDINKIKIESDKKILINNVNLKLPYAYKSKSLIVTNDISYEDTAIIQDNEKGTILNDLNLNIDRLTITNSYLPYVTKYYKPDYIYLDDSFIFSSLIKVFQIPKDVISVKNFLLSSPELSLWLKDKVLTMFNQITQLKRIGKCSTNFTFEEVNTIVSLLKERNMHYYWYYLFQHDKPVYFFKELNLYSSGTYNLYYFYFNMDLFDYPCKFIITTFFDKSLWKFLDNIKNEVEYQEIKSKLDNVIIHPQYSFSYSQLMNIKNFRMSKEYKYIKRCLGDRDVIITHKSMIERFINNGLIRVSPSIYFGSQKAYPLNNDVKIIGTPRLKEVYYFALALLLNIPIDELNKTKFGSYNITYKGVSFPFRAYSLLMLNELMCIQIESEFRRLITSIGNGFLVDVFTSFYIPGVKIQW